MKTITYLRPNYIDEKEFLEHIFKDLKRNNLHNELFTVEQQQSEYIIVFNKEIQYTN